MHRPLRPVFVSRVALALWCYCNIVGGPPNNSPWMWMLEAPKMTAKQSVLPRAYFAIRDFGKVHCTGVAGRTLGSRSALCLSSQSDGVAPLHRRYELLDQSIWSLASNHLEEPCPEGPRQDVPFACTCRNNERRFAQFHQDTLQGHSNLELPGGEVFANDIDLRHDQSHLPCRSRRCRNRIISVWASFWVIPAPVACIGKPAERKFREISKHAKGFGRKRLNEKWHLERGESFWQWSTTHKFTRLNFGSLKF